MMVLIFLYNLVALPIILLLSIIFSIFNTKIRKGLIGRFNSFSALKSFQTNKFSQIYWFHCASFGEYQQVETLIEQIKKRDQGIGIITSFFSPSGFENVNDRNIDLKIYLPFDFIFSSFRALRIVKPSKIFFTSSDFWPSFLFAANQLNISTVLTSARYRKSYNIFLKMFNKIFCVSDDDYHQIKMNISNDEIYKIGNPRYDRILNNLENVDFISNENIKIATIKKSIFAIVKSGTVSLEVCKYGIPSIIIYKMNFLNFFIAKLFLKIKYANMINIINNREIIPELLQNECNSDEIYKTVNYLLNKPEIINEQLKQVNKTIKELRSKYLFTLIYCFIEKNLLNIKK